MPSRRGGREGGRAVDQCPHLKHLSDAHLKKICTAFSFSFLKKKTFRKTNSPRDKILERSSGSGWWGASVCMTECQYKDWFTAFYWERPVEIRRNKTSALLKATVQPVLPLTFVLFLFFQDPSFSTTYMTVWSTLLLFTMVLFSCSNCCLTFAMSKKNDGSV